MQLHTVTLDNTSNNTTTCQEIAAIHKCWCQSWLVSTNQLPCLAHVINLTTVDVMSHITKIAAVETTTAIWEYDPSLPGNCVLGESLDVIATIRTLAVKVTTLFLMAGLPQHQQNQIFAIEVIGNCRDS
ncbi:hypothetical protein BD779DRAFT_1684807 [Infundibulicybe gibba]|nr:hypothetical protein BD779DRAFT_1684807 [Infundibulicybe gibba]